MGVKRSITQSNRVEIEKYKTGQKSTNGQFLLLDREIVSFQPTSSGFGVLSNK